MYGPIGCQHLVVDEGVDPDLHGGGGVVMVLLEDEHLKMRVTMLIVNLQNKEGKCLHILPLWVRDTLWCLCPLVH